MNSPLSAAQVLTREYLEIRGKILEVAASLDRMERADGALDDEPRRQLLQEALQTLAESRSDRAETIQLLLSRPYETNWRTAWGLAREASPKPR